MNREQRLTELRSELFDIANAFAKEKQGVIAVELHESCNCILRALEMLEHGESKENADRQIERWCDDQFMPVSPAERQLIKQLLNS